MPSRASRVRRPVLLALLLAFTPVAASAQGLASTAPTPRGIIVGSWKDLTALPSVDTLTILGVGGAAAGVAHLADHDVNRQMHGADYRFLGSGRVLGNAGLQLGAAVGTYVVGYRAGGRHSRAARVGAELIRAQILSQGLTFAIKAATQRPRPDATDRWSLPSGHASTTFATATVLAGHFGWRVSVPAYLVATYVAASRLHHNRHYASDVVFGAALGIAVAHTVRARSTSPVTVHPQVYAGGAGVVVTW